MDTVVTLLVVIALLTPLRSEVRDLQEIAVTKCAATNFGFVNTSGVLKDF